MQNLQQVTTRKINKYGTLKYSGRFWPLKVKKGLNLLLFTYRGALFMPKTVPAGGLRPIITIYGGTVKGRAPEDRYFLEFITIFKGSRLTRLDRPESGIPSDRPR